MSLSEFALIERFFRKAGAMRADVHLGVGDDAALLQSPPGAQLVAAMDTLVEGVHFPRGSPPASIGHRVLAVNLSDLAAMGARPAWALLALTLPRCEERCLAEFAAGLGALARAHGAALAAARAMYCLSPAPPGTRPPAWPSSRGVWWRRPPRAVICVSAFCCRHRGWRSASGCARMPAPASMCQTDCWAMSASWHAPVRLARSWSSSGCRCRRRCVRR